MNRICYYPKMVDPCIARQRKHSTSNKDTILLVHIEYSNIHMYNNARICLHSFRPPLAIFSNVHQVGEHWFCIGWRPSSITRYIGPSRMSTGI